jgi:NADH-quinone oxidoreductase subunit M
MSRFVAYTSIAHFGFIALGTFAFSSQAFAGATLYMVNHGLSTGMLFVMVGLLVVRGGSRLIGDYGGVSALTPVLAGCLLLAGMSSLALPGTNSFVSEFLVLVGSFPNEPVATIIATVGIIFAALYILWFYQQTMQGPLRGQAVLRSLEPVGGPGAMIDPAVAAKRGGGFPDLTKREIGVLAPLIVVIVVLGFFPKPVLDVVNPSVQSTMTEIGLPDPVPAGGVAK